MGSIAIQLFAIFGPIVADLITKHRAATGVDPTDAELQATFAENVDKYLGAGAAWTAAHPKPSSS